MSSMKSLWSEFKSFAFKGNMIDLAVAVIIGGAFSGVITSLVGDIIMPAVSYVVTAVSETSAAVQNVAGKAGDTIGITKPTAQPTTVFAPASGPADASTTLPATAPATRPVVAIAGPATAPGPMIIYVTAPAAPSAPPAAPKDEKAPDKAVDFTWKIGRIRIGNFVGALVNFIIIAFAVFIIVVKLLGSAMRRVAGGTPTADEPTTKECPECLSIIPLRAKRCSNCTSVLPPTP